MVTVVLFLAEELVSHLEALINQPLVLDLNVNSLLSVEAIEVVTATDLELVDLDVFKIVEAFVTDLVNLVSGEDSVPLVEEDNEVDSLVADSSKS